MSKGRVFALLLVVGGCSSSEPSSGSGGSDGATSSSTLSASSASTTSAITTSASTGDVGTGGVDGVGGGGAGGTGGSGSGGSGEGGSGGEGLGGEGGTGGQGGAGGEGPCLDGDLSCVGNEIHVCDAGVFSFQQTCPITCVAGACALCDPGLRRCDGDVAQLCDPAGSWIVDEECDGSTPVCSLGSCFECEPGAERCGAESETFLQSCNASGVWEDVDECPFYCSVAEGCFGDCLDSDQECGLYDWLGDGDLSPTVFSCDETGTWSPADWCPVDCDPLYPRCTQCEPGQVECGNSTVLQVCDNEGIWEYETCSGDTPYCLVDACVECQPTAPGLGFCVGDDPITFNTCSAAGTANPPIECDFLCADTGCYGD